MSQPSGDRRGLILSMAILAGLIIGIFIKRLHIGLVIGMVLGLLIMGLSRRR